MVIARDGKGNSDTGRSFTKGNLRAIVKSLDIYDDIKNGETHNQCLDFSEIVLRELLDRGVDAIMVQSRDDSGTPIHHYVLAQVGSDIDRHPVIVDPTIGQFYHKYKDVFVGTQDEMHERFVKGGKSQRIFDEYWPSKINVCEPESVYEDGQHTPPSKVDPKEFQEKWGDFGVVQKERFTAAYSSKRRLPQLEESPSEKNSASTLADAVVTATRDGGGRSGPR